MDGGRAAAVTPSEVLARLALWRVSGIGPRAYAGLLSTFGSAAAALSAGREAWRAAGLDTALQQALAQADWQGAERDLAWVDGAADRHLLMRGQPPYPQRLAEIPAAPPLLFVLGDPTLLEYPQLAIVGSRKPTAGGRQSARDFAAHLASYGLGITSGLALGVDGAAHRGALDGGGYTIAVTATGPDRLYPAAHQALAARIAEKGAIVTEFPTGVGPRPEHFPRRNRIISGLSLGVLVVEAGLRSGSLITARYALEQGREVFAIPGSIHNPLAKGCHELIRRAQAKLVEQGADILEELTGQLELPHGAPANESSPPQEQPPDDPDHAAVLEALGHDPVTLDAVLQRTGLTAEAVSSILLILELQGHVTAVSGGRYMRRWPEGVK